MHIICFQHEERAVFGVILTGGQSRRMSFNKLRLKNRSGECFIEHTLRLLSSFCDGFILQGETDIDDLLLDMKTHTDISCMMLRDIDSQKRGPLWGVYALLQSGLAAEYLILPSDMPELNEELLERLLGEYKRDTHLLDGICFEQKEEIFFFPLILKASSLQKVEALCLAGERRFSALFTQLQMKYVPVLPDEVKQLVNVNTPEEYGKWYQQSEDDDE